MVFSYRYFFCCAFGFAVLLQFAFVLQDLAMPLIGPGIFGVVAELLRHGVPQWPSSTVDWADPGEAPGIKDSASSSPRPWTISLSTDAWQKAPWELNRQVSSLHSQSQDSSSIAQFQHNNPWRMFIFFLLHALGIVVQTRFCLAFRPWLKKIPKLIRQIGNFAFTFTWWVVTGPLFADGVARRGSWLNDAVPFSLFRV
jgi:hypothetical protein